MGVQLLGSYIWDKGYMVRVNSSIDNVRWVKVLPKSWANEVRAYGSSHRDAAGPFL